MKDSYVDSRTGGVWFIFGVYDSGNVDIHSADGEVFENVPKELADKILALRRRFIFEMYELTRDL
jgi:hypothetical protein